MFAAAHVHALDAGVSSSASWEGYRVIEFLTLRGFKAFSEQVSAQVRPLLLLTGANSSGKTSIIQAILLLSQTLDSPRRDVALDLGGPLIEFSEFRDAVFGRPPNVQGRFSVGFQVALDDPDLLLTLRANPQQAADQLARHRYFPGRPSAFFRGIEPATIARTTTVEVTFGATTLGRPYVQSLVLQKLFTGSHLVTHRLEKSGAKYRVTISTAPHETPPQATRGSDLRALDSALSWLADLLRSARVTGPPRARISLVSLVDNLLSFYGLGWDTGDEDIIAARRAISAIKLPIARPVDPECAKLIADISWSLVSLVAGIPSESSYLLPIAFDHFFPATNYSYREADPRVDAYTTLYLACFGDATSEIRRYLRSIDYLGPLRAKPERAYLPSGTPLDVGRSGENAVPILWLEKNDKVLTKTSIGGPPSRKALGAAVQEWFEQFGVAHALHVTKPKRVIYQAALDGPPQSRTRVTIADVGFGVSQLLPVVVAGLRAQPGATLILEQPEIHLHPKLQAKLADFLLALVDLGKNVIVETHSEHLVNALRLRVAEDLSGARQGTVSILFVECGTSSGPYPSAGSRVTSLEVDSLGQIANWPADFFPEHADTNERLLRAIIARGKKL